jgi:hypothetical protein
VDPKSYGLLQSYGLSQAKLDEIQPKKSWAMADYGLWQLWVKTALSVMASGKKSP